MSRLLGACHGDVLSRVERARKWKQVDGDEFGRFVAGVVFSTATCHLFQRPARRAPKSQRLCNVRNGEIREIL